MSIRNVFRLTCTAALAVFLGGCPFGGSGGITPALKQIPAETQVLLAKKGMTQEAPILVRIFKEESQLEIWKEKSDGRFHHFKTYPICNWSGDLGPKVREGDKQSPEGFYTVTAGQMNPNSQFHLSFNLGYPNDYDKVNGRTGSALMVHGDCRSAGCFAMTDALIEEIYALAREAFNAGQSRFHVHAFPFRMTPENMKRHSDNRWYSFWKTLKVGYDDFELTRIPPKVAVCSRQYLVNADFFGHVAQPDPASNCPAYRRVPGEPFSPFGDGQQQAQQGTTSSTQPGSRLASYSHARGTPSADEDEDGEARKAEETKSAVAATPSQAPASSAQPTMALSASPAVQAQPEEKTHPDEQPTLHTVVKSGKGDMAPTATSN